MHIKSGDKVVVISGKDKGKVGKVLSVLPKQNRLVVEDVNMVTKHNKPMGPTQPGGIVKFEGAINASKVMLYCDKDEQGVRISKNILEDGTKVRACAKCGEIFDK